MTFRDTTGHNVGVLGSVESWLVSAGRDRRPGSPLNVPPCPASNFVLGERRGPLAHLGLGQAYALSGEATKARTTYEDFFAIWKDADPDVPILKEAKAEYAKLQ